MSLNYDNVNLSEISEDVRQRYAFPADKNFLQRYMHGEGQFKREDLYNIQDQATTDIFWSILALTVGATSYCFLLMPSGKVIRDRINSQTPFPKRLLNRFLPFIGLALPIYILRSRLDFTNGYKN